MNNNQFEECKGLSGKEQYFIEIYTGPIYKTVNEFMTNRDSLDTYQGIRAIDFARYFYSIIVDSNNDEYVKYNPGKYNRVKPLIQSKCNNIEWFQKIIFNYMTTLYEGILKCPR